MGMETSMNGENGLDHTLAELGQPSIVLDSIDQLFNNASRGKMSLDYKSNDIYQLRQWTRPLPQLIR